MEKIPHMPASKAPKEMHHHAKIQVLKHLSGLMDHLAAGKMKKKPALEVSVESIAVPKHEDPMHEMEHLEDPLAGKDPLAEMRKHQPKTPELPDADAGEKDAEDLARLKDLYSSIK
jgi:hypothetical protein